MGNNYIKYSISSGSNNSSFKTKGGRNSQSTVNDYPEFIVKLSKILEEKSKEEENSNGICEKTFQKYICKASKSVGQHLFKFFLIKERIGKESNVGSKATNGISKESNGVSINEKKTNDWSAETLSRDAFARQTSMLLNCLNDSQQLEYYISVFASDKEEMSCNEFYELVAAAYEIARFAQHSSSTPDNLLAAVTKAVMHGKERTTCKYVFNWVCQHCPRIVLWMHRYICHALTVGYSTIPRNASTEKEDDATTPILDGASQISCATFYPTLIWMLSCTLPATFTENVCPPTPPATNLASLRDPHKFIEQLMLADKPSHWIPLFHSDEHGFSMNRFKHHVFDYHGPTLLFITADDKSLFCVAIDEEWRDSKHFFGRYESMCLQLIPEYKIIERGANIIYFNLTSRGFPTGLQVGSDKTDRALSVDINFELVHYRKIPYKLRTLEVWGCGTRHVKEKQNEYKRQANKDVECRRKVNLDKQEWRDNPDRYLLEMAGARPNYTRFEKDTQSHSSMK